jgi:hypothetical protein
MSRIDIRTREAWRAYDFWNGIIALTIPAVLAGLWLTGVTPPPGTCCNGAITAARGPVVAPGPIPAALVSAEVSLAWADGKVTLKGKIADDRTREELVAQARRVFGIDNVLDRLEIVPGRGALPWIGAVRQIFGDLRELSPPASLAANASLVTLGGAVETEADKEMRGVRARQLFGDGVTIVNGLSVRAPKAAAPRSGG